MTERQPVVSITCIVGVDAFHFTDKPSTKEIELNTSEGMHAGEK